jgi:hypothetical protein
MSAVTAVEFPTIKLTDPERPDCGECGERARVLVEVAPDADLYVPRCSEHIEVPAVPTEPRLTAEAEIAFALTSEQCQAIFAGDHTALKTEIGESKPKVDAGQHIVLATSRGGKQFLAKTEKERQGRVEKGLQLLTEIPSEPTVWIELHEPRLKEGRWRIPFDARDTRESTRTLASAPAGPRQSGLKTRLRKRVLKKGEYKPPSLSDDAARGYGGGGKSTVDEREGIDDGTLDRYTRLALKESEMKRRHKRRDDKAMEREMRVAEIRKRDVERARLAPSLPQVGKPVGTSAPTV